MFPQNILRIDVHHHFFLDARKKAKKNLEVGWRTPDENLPWRPQTSLAAMDKLGVQTAILSPPPISFTPHDGAEDLAKVRQQNIYSSQLRATYPSRFGFLAGLPFLDDVKGSLEEIAFSFDVLGADGVALLSSYGDGNSAKYVADDLYDPIWKELDRRHAVVFLHGAQTPSSTPYPHPWLGVPISEVPNETYKAAAHLVVSGKKRRFHNVNIILTHLGGSTPFLAPRVAALSHYMGCPLTPEEIIEDFKSFYYETALSAHETTLTAMSTLVPSDRLLFGTDFPAVSTKTAEWYTENLENYFAGRPLDLANIMRDNALRLFPNLGKSRDQYPSGGHRIDDQPHDGSQCIVDL
jgi:predicted TIM-barrel fold metal-dependent hydrolase